MGNIPLQVSSNAGSSYTGSSYGGSSLNIIKDSQDNKCQECNIYFNREEHFPCDLPCTHRICTSCFYRIVGEQASWQCSICQRRFRCNTRLEEYAQAENHLKQIQERKNKEEKDQHEKIQERKKKEEKDQHEKIQERIKKEQEEKDQHEKELESEKLHQEEMEHYRKVLEKAEKANLKMKENTTLLIETGREEFQATREHIEKTHEMEVNMMKGLFGATAYLYKEREMYNGHLEKAGNKDGRVFEIEEPQTAQKVDSTQSSEDNDQQKSKDTSNSSQEPPSEVDDQQKSKDTSNGSQELPSEVDDQQKSKDTSNSSQEHLGEVHDQQKTMNTSTSTKGPTYV